MIEAKKDRIIKLTDEQVWLSIFNAAMSCPGDDIDPYLYADHGLEGFRDRFRRDELPTEKLP